MDELCPKPNAEDARDAYYEAGQAVMAWIEGFEVKQVSIDGEEGPSIQVGHPAVADPDNRDRNLALSVIRTLLAGAVAQQRYSFGDEIWGLDLANPHDCLLDQSVIWDAINLAGCIQDCGPAVLPRVWREAEATLYAPRVWAAVEAVAAALLHERELAGCEVSDIALHAMRRFVFEAE